jgi:hypothetical protein
MEKLMNLRIKVFWPATRLIALSMVLGGVLFGLVNPALAKGPESVTIKGPGIDQQINFMDNNNVDFEVKLMEQMGIWFGTGIPLTAEEIKVELGPGYTFTWVNSGPPSMSVAERTIIQQVYLDGETGPIIHTPVQDSLQGWGPGTIGWFAAPDELKDTLAKLKVQDSQSPIVLEAHMFRTSRDTVLAKPTPTGSPWYLTVVGVALFGMFGLIAIRLVKGKIMAS